MHKEKPSNFLGRCTKLAPGNSKNEGCQKYQEKSQPTVYSTKHTTRNSHPHNLCFKHHQICHSGEQATHQHSKGHSRKDTPGHHNTQQLHKFTVQQLELQAGHTLHSLYSSKSSRFSILYERSHHAYNGLHRCSHNWNTLNLSPHVLPVEDLRKMFLHNEEALPLTMHLPVSSEDTLHFYRCLCTHVLIADEQFLLLINVPIQDHAQQLEIYEVFNLVIPHRHFSAHYNINSKYLGITYDETKTVEISEDQFSTCQKANRQFCSYIHPSTTCKSTNVYSRIICKEQSWH